MKFFKHPQRIDDYQPSHHSEQKVGEFEHTLQKPPATHFVRSNDTSSQWRCFYRPITVKTPEQQISIKMATQISLEPDQLNRQSTLQSL